MYNFYKKVAIACVVLICIELIWSIISIGVFNINNLSSTIISIISLIFITVVFFNLESHFKELSKSLDECREKLNLSERKKTVENELQNETEFKQSVKLNKFEIDFSYDEYSEYTEEEWNEKIKELKNKLNKS